MMSKFADANFVWNFGEFKGFALKNPIRGVAPEPHELFEKSSTKTFSCHSQTSDKDFRTK